MDEERRFSWLLYLMAGPSDYHFPPLADVKKLGNLICLSDLIDRLDV